jgi:peroxiredoxin (alkyl hydroperoxide reductase subunit C)
LRPIRTHVRDEELGGKVIVPPPNTLEEMDARIADTSCEKIDFYVAKKQL